MRPLVSAAAANENPRLSFITCADALTELHLLVKKKKKKSVKSGVSVDSSDPEYNHPRAIDPILKKKSFLVAYCTVIELSLYLFVFIYLLIFIYFNQHFYLYLSTVKNYYYKYA